YGIMNEPLAAKRYEEVLRSMGHDVTITSCGLLVNPAFPWLGASPDRIVYDPEEASYGVVEIKCPYSLRETKGAELAGLSFYSKLSDSGPRLDRDNHYYSQVTALRTDALSSNLNPTKLSSSARHSVNCGIPQLATECTLSIRVYCGFPDHGRLITAASPRLVAWIETEEQEETRTVRRRQNGGLEGEM
ncbi:hypothetical protein HPB47_006388, partial [Ixodes persulcatus]